MADSATTVQESSMPYLYPQSHLTDPIPPTEDGTENIKEEKKTETTINVEDKDNKESDFQNDDDENEDEEAKKETEKPLLEDDIVKIPLNEGEDTPTLPLPDKEKKSLDEEDLEKQQKDKLPVYLFPFSRIKQAWNESSNTFQFLGTAICIIFQTVGWFTCVGGIPFLSLVMLIIGSIYVDECKIEPNIPVYLIVSGVVGTLQHIITIWTKYVPKESHGKLRVYRRYCNSLNGIFHLFLTMWFIVGCVWVYGAHSEVEFKDREKNEYCHKTLYYFSFWILNLSFIFLGLLVVLSICFLVCMVASGDK